MNAAFSEYDVRDALSRMLFKELVGPADGPEEVLTEDPRDRYLFGVLGYAGAQAPPRTEPDIPEGEAHDEEAPDTPAAAARPLMIPNSFGFTFCVNLAEAPDAALRIAASWGRYESLPQTDQGRRRRRRPIEATVVPDLIPAVAAAAGGPLTLRLQTADGHTVEHVEVSAVVRPRDDARHRFIITLFLINRHTEPARGKSACFLFQARLEVREARLQPVFIKHPSHDPRLGMDPLDREELADLDMRYRRQVEFAVGHGISVHASPDPADSTRAHTLATTSVPHYEVPRTDPAELPDIPLGMAALADADDPADLLAPLVAQYDAWIAARHADLGLVHVVPPEWRTRGETTLQRCREARDRMAAGLQLLREDPEAVACFRFANRAMYLQRVRGLFAEARRKGEAAPDLAAFDQPALHRWRPFQLAFVLLNLPGLTRRDHPERAVSGEAVADLLFFPTGGGKTEAYLGLAAYTLALRRRQGSAADQYGDGVAVLMRYSLRLLTLQQYQRAAALICACETLRRADPATWGQTPFRIGLWVGAATTPNRTEDAAQALAAANKSGGRRAAALSQFPRCPWCGHKIDTGTHVRTGQARGRTLTFCGDPLGTCAFSPKRSPDEGLPVVAVDEEIYRLLPALVIATVDKFAQMPLNGQVQMLFGRVTGRCERHGYRSPETADSDHHPAGKGLPAARTLPCAGLRPPDLIIQDELHLISGPLGTLVGLYETAVEQLAVSRYQGRDIRPKLILSTATVRRAADQVKCLFNHQVAVFPPPGLDADDTFFSIRRKPCPDTPGRLYLGLCAPGRKIKNVMIRVYSVLLRAGRGLFNQHDTLADPYMTLVGYFNSRRELGGVRRMVDDAISAQAAKPAVRGMAPRYIAPASSVAELTSRLEATDVPEVLDNLALPFSLKAEAARKAAMETGKHETARTKPYDVLLATNMFQVGVDIPRLGLMVVTRQPKTTAEYIQATSRVGRRAPGLVITVFNYAHPRDLSHYERFEAYHAAFYKFVEANSVTPFSPRARDRALTAVLVSLVRQLDAGLNANYSAGYFDAHAPHVTRAVEAVLARVAVIGDPMLRDQVRDELQHRLDIWTARAQRKPGGARLVYRASGRDGDRDQSLLQIAGRDQQTNARDALFTVPSSLRNVEPPVNLAHHIAPVNSLDPPIVPLQGGAD